MSEWRSADSYWTRVIALENGVGFNQSFMLNGKTVKNNLAVDTLMGGGMMGGNNDWYFFHSMGNPPIKNQDGLVYPI
jgi:hypothetical protein